MEGNSLCLANSSKRRKFSWIQRVHFLPSEEIMLLDKTANGGICLTSFRMILYCRHQSNVISIPTMLIRLCETSSLFDMEVSTKIGTTFTCQFKSVHACEAWIKQLSILCGSVKEFSHMFARQFRDELRKRVSSHPLLSSAKETFDLGANDTTLEAEMILQEFNRLEFDNNWKITDVNSDFQICKSYPKYHILPRDVSDQDIPNIATFRSHHRFPSVVWRSCRTGAVLLRCAQPRVGIMYSRSEYDERFVAAILENCRKDPLSKQSHGDSCNLLIIDARYYSSAQFNRLRGGGFEYKEYYDQSQIRFADLPNLHAVRMSFERLMLLWLATLERSLWLSYISQLLKSAVEIAAALDVNGRPVMVHCTDGWDRTPQLTSLAELLLDPYYRTIRGFRILIEREWLQFGHKFGDRCGHSLNSCSSEEQSPIFLQWLDCVRQIQRQFPHCFEFNELFLVKIAIHTYSGLFGTFLCNSELERQENRCASQTCSIWAYLNPTYNWSIINYLYEEKNEVINPAWHVSNLELWDTLYVNALLPSNASGALSQPPVLVAPLRRASDTSSPLQISTSSPATNTDLLSCRPSASIAVPTPATLSETAEVHGSSATLADVRQRSQSLSDVNHKHADLPTIAPTTFQSETAAASLFRQSTSLERVTMVRVDASPSVPDFLSIAPPDVPPNTDPKLVVINDKENLNVSRSDQNLVRSVPNRSPHRHMRSGSDPPFSSANRLRLSSLGDTDILVVNKAPLDDSHDVEEAEGSMTAGDEVLATLSVPCSGDGEDVGGEGMTHVFMAQHAFPSTSSFSPMSQSTISLSGAACYGMRAWIDGYFGRPVFSAQFRMLADESVSAGANDESIGSQINLPSVDQTKRDIMGEADSVDDCNPNSLIGSRTRSHTEGESHQNLRTNSEALPGSPTLLASSGPDRVNLSNGTSWDLAASKEPPVTPERGFSVDWDGLPLRVDPVTLKFHERQRQEDHIRAEHQSHIDRLEANIACLLQEVARLRALVDDKSNESNLQGIFTTSASSSAELFSSPLISPEVTATQQNSHGDGQANPPSSIVEALSDAIGNHQGVDDHADCGGIYVRTNGTPVKPHSLMTQSATDDILLNWPDGFAPHNVTSCTFNPPPLRRRCCPSPSSDYSSFDVVESSALLAYSGVPGGPACGGCDSPLDGILSPLPCGYCLRNFCGNCSETPRELNNCKPICGACYRGCPFESIEARQLLADSQTVEEGDVYCRGYAAHLSCAPLPGSCTSSTTATAISCSSACADGGICRRLERRFPSGSPLTCSSAHSQNGTAKA
ncbi:Myotubularin-related protein [Echinococcus granulosus]|uniref:Myotubularin-related protein n=1 Tax=Echinococcus granulosus TaxID=6210 RepID=W6UR77_ECHGR|nr:Myotubularin-related protein [Echinococcus granulosus]EUB64235.1 Myotubularin-related protein [Echinococcus granulosus]